ncbi:MAG: hypothetical protein KAY24_02310 [Candidatus Eisenbacteria sp.]|nr:hypothetical protein [Candidatus Eisenbacteria bacterium]
MSEPLFIFTAAGIALTILASAFVIFAVRKMKHCRQDLIDRLATQLKAEARGSSVIGSIQGLQYECAYSEGSQRTKSAFTIRLKSAFPVTMTIRRRTAFDAFATRVGLVEAVQTGDPAFDEKLFVESENRDFASRYLMDASRRLDISSIFAGSIDCILFRPEGVDLHVPSLALQKLEPSGVENVLNRALSLIRMIPDLGTTGSVPQKHISTRKLLVILALGPALLAQAGMFMIMQGMTKYSPLESIVGSAVMFALPFALAGTVILCAGAFRIFRKRSDAHILFMVVAVCALLTLMINGVGYYVFTNGYLDDSLEETHMAAVLGKEMRRHDKSADHLLVISSWHGIGSHRTLEVNRRFYEDIQKGDQIAITTKAGYQHVEWLVAYEKSVTIGAAQTGRSGCQ